jgi:IclR family acetate operon transcriptional repressor
MRALRDESGETVNLAIADQGEVVFLTQAESRQMMRAITRAGGRAPMHCSGLGKALLACMTEREVGAILHRHGMQRLTPNSIARPRALQEALSETRRRGYAVDDEEYAVGLRCVAAPIFDEHRSAIAALSVSGPTVRIPDKAVPALGRLVVASADRISAAIGGSRPARRD